MAKISFEKEKPDFAVVEAMNTLRTNLIYSGNVKAITVTSTFPNEGKSTVTVNLAKSFAELGKKVLLIDCDLRKSEILCRYDATEELEGLSEFLSGQSTKVIQPTDVENLFFISCGKLPPNPSELLSGRKFELFLKALRENYDYIILDAPPIASVIDAAIIGRITDGTVLVIRNEFTRKRAVLDCKQQLERNGNKILGVILNRVQKHQKDYYYYSKYYKYGYGHENEK